MTSMISGQFQSPRSMMDARISAAVSAGSISSTDQTALSSALDAIDSSLSTDRASGTKPTSGIKDRVDALIEEQVKAGTLTEDQASELRDFFAQGPGGPSGVEGTDGAQAMDGPRGPGGPPPPPRDSSDSDDSSTTSTDTETAAKALDQLIAFLQQLRTSYASSTYGSSTNASDSSNSGLVVDATA